MKKLIITLFALLTILLITSASYAYKNIDGDSESNCQSCHETWDTGNSWHDTDHRYKDCSICHGETASDPIPTTSCKDCHIEADSGWAGLPEYHGPSGNCMSCHEETEPACPLESSMKIGDARLATLRLFRDEVLAANKSGRAIIKVYYTAAPVLTRAVNSSPLFKQMTVRLIDAIIPVIERTLD